ncbi:Sec63 complex subunit SEC66 [Rhodotorula paludigena]|uniref:Sec63 complex subunit SEC66 n=1 Tax=Rhodotorula paludigena TaxID=86838 RepID=UPI003177DC13
MDDVKLIWSIRDAKTSLTTLLQKGQIGDDLWERFLLAEKELEAEIVEVVGEANTFEPGYGQKIFNVASDMVSHERWKDVYRDIAKRRDEENAKLSTGLPAAAVLAPTSYLTPSSLTLSPSNPLPTAGTSPAPGPAPGAALAKPLGAPDAAEITDRPPSRESTPAPSAAADGPVSADEKNGVATPQKSGGGGGGGAGAAAADPDEVDVGAAAGTGADEAKTPASAPAQQQQQQGTPKKTPNSKKGKRKPPVKGGR